MNHGAFLMRGTEKVRGEFSLTALAYNLRRGSSYRGVHDLDGSGTGLKARSAHLPGGSFPQLNVTSPLLITIC
jgi:hypothetical protein